MEIPKFNKSGFPVKNKSYHRRQLRRKEGWMQRLIKDTKWEVWNDDPKHTLYGTTLHRGARLTILHRETGFTNEAGLPVWDTESAYRDENGNFWCASGNFDARDYPESTVEELILILKNRATVRPDGEEEESK